MLIVDDELDVAELIADQLAPLDVDTAIAASGEQALVALRGERFDAVTLDILMPSMDGFEVLRQIRADPDLRATPIVFVSVFSARTELSGEWVVAKPIDAAELRHVLAAAVRAGRSRVLIVGREELQRDARARSGRARDRAPVGDVRCGSRTSVRGAALRSRADRRRNS